MSIEEKINLAASAYAALSGIVFMIAYSTLARWYRSSVGRMIMSLVAGVTGLGLITVIVYFTHDVEMLRLARAILVTMIGTSVWWQALTVVRVQRRNRKT